MQLLEQVNAARDAYLARVVGSRESGLARHDAYAADIFLELPVRGALLGDCCRLDGAGVSGPSVSISDIHFEDKPLNIATKGAKGSGIRCRSFNWGGTRFRLASGFLGRKAVDLPLDEVEAWFDRWIGARPPADLAPSCIGSLRTWVLENPCGSDGNGNGGHRGTIHAVCLLGDDQLTVDFGSAPVAAFEDLLAVLEGSGATRIFIEEEPHREEVLYGRIIAILQNRTPAPELTAGPCR